MTLPLLISVPHAGSAVPPEAEPYCMLTPEQIQQDGDEGAAETFSLADDVEAFVTTDVARAIVDMNRAEDDRRADGVVKTHTCWQVAVYHAFPPQAVITELLARYHRPYHARLTEHARAGVVLGIDCHTMAAHGPPIGPNPGIRRPLLCLSNAEGTCPRAWLEALKGSFEASFRLPVALNDPFKGGHIIRSHASELPWVQLEISRAPFLTNRDKRARVLGAMDQWCRSERV